MAKKPRQADKGWLVVSRVASCYPVAERVGTDRLLLQPRILHRPLVFGLKLAIEGDVLIDRQGLTL